MEYNINQPWLTLDDWQKEYIAEVSKDCWLLTGRQVGKTTAMAIKCVELALHFPGDYMVCAFTEDQGANIFQKCLIYLQMRYPEKIMTTAKHKPSAHHIWLKNGGHIFLKALGLTGIGARGSTLKRIFIDEAQSCLRYVFVALLPSLSVAKGKIDMAGTPAGKQGYFYECSDEPELGEKIMPNLRRWKITAEMCPRHTQKELDKAKKMMTEREYAQEYLAQFLDDIQRVYPDELIQQVCVREKETGIATGRYYLGVDIARLGEDLTSFQVIRKIHADKFEHAYSEIARKKLTTWTENRILELDALFKFKKIAIDAGSGSLGVGIYDHLINEPKIVEKVVAINNREITSRINEKKSKFKIMKEDLTNNLLFGLLKNKLTLLKDEEVAASLASVQWENIVSVGKLTKTRIFGKYTHTEEALKRAFWEASHDTSLSLWAAG